MTPENPNIPGWAQRERQADFDWIAENLDVFWTAATSALEDVGRGAIVVDTTLEPIPGAGNPFIYFPQEQVEERGNEDTQRMVAEYDPMQEFVIVLLKSNDHISTYRVSAIPSERKRAVAEHTIEPEPTPPDMETLITWEAEGGCESTCLHGCWVKPDGTCPHGNHSWLLRLGLI